jgi:hypothetical protein
LNWTPKLFEEVEVPTIHGLYYIRMIEIEFGLDSISEEINQVQDQHHLKERIIQRHNEVFSIPWAIDSKPLIEDETPFQVQSVRASLHLGELLQKKRRKKRLIAISFSQCRSSRRIFLSWERLMRRGLL